MTREISTTKEKCVVIIHNTLRFSSDLSCMRRATSYHRRHWALTSISIHVLHAENDCSVAKCAKGQLRISIHVLHAENDSKALQNTACCISLYYAFCLKTILFHLYYSDLFLFSSIKSGANLPGILWAFEVRTVKLFFIFYLCTAYSLQIPSCRLRKGGSLSVFCSACSCGLAGLLITGI